MNWASFPHERVNVSVHSPVNTRTSRSTALVWICVLWLPLRCQCHPCGSVAITQLFHTSPIFPSLARNRPSFYFHETYVILGPYVAELRRADWDWVLPTGFTFVGRAGCGPWPAGAGAARAGGQAGLTRPRGSQAPRPQPTRERGFGAWTDAGRAWQWERIARSRFTGHRLQ